MRKSQFDRTLSSNATTAPCRRRRSRGRSICLGPAGGGIGVRDRRRCARVAIRRASADALVMPGQLYHLIEAGDLPAARRRKSTRSSLSGRIRVPRAPRRDHRAVPLHGPLYGNHRPLFSRRPKARIAVVKGAAFSRACSSEIDAASSRWPISHIRRASTATTTITTNPITSSPTATVGLCSSTDQASPHSYCRMDDGES